jgi:hypothetical protein
LFAPELATELDPSTIVFLDKEVFTDVSSGQRHEVDVLARASFRGGDSFCLVHVENQAQSQADFARRMFRYFARLDEKHGLPIYPITVFSHQVPRVEPNEYVVTFGSRLVLRFAFHSIQLPRLHWRDYLRSSNPVAAALMARMGMAAGERPRVKLECLRLLTGLPLDRARQQLVSGFVDTYLRLEPAEELQFNEQADTLLGQIEKERIMELTTSWKEQGRAEGKIEGGTCVVLRQLHRRYGALPLSLQERVRRLSLPRLETLAEALLDFSSPSELEQWLDDTAPEEPRRS